MSNTAIVTDSTTSIPPELIAEYSITVLPLNIIWGNETFMEGVDIQTDQFYDRLKTNKTLPTTSQPSPELFRRAYEKLLNEGKEILSVHISARLSGTVFSALQARSMLDSDRIEVVDSRLTSMALGFPVLAAARAAKEGASLDECKAIVERCCLNAGVFFTVSTLEYLHKGGRIGGASAFLGTALDLKPILTLIDGKIEPIERVRTINKASEHLIDHLKKQVGKKSPLNFAIIHAMSYTEGQKLLDRVSDAFPTSQIDSALICDISPVIGAHTGPGTLGIAYMTGI
ncbi:MAG: DegV family protein [Chloroflexi bacterium]|nr:DegV family protein [Chloroflexota bacterium]